MAYLKLLRDGGLLFLDSLQSGHEFHNLLSIKRSCIVAFDVMFFADPSNQFLSLFDASFLCLHKNEHRSILNNMTYLSRR